MSQARKFKGSTRCQWPLGVCVRLSTLLQFCWQLQPGYFLAQYSPRLDVNVWCSKSSICTVNQCRDSASYIVAQSVGWSDHFGPFSLNPPHDTLFLVAMGFFLSTDNSVFLWTVPCRCHYCFFTTFPFLLPHFFLSFFQSFFCFSLINNWSLFQEFYLRKNIWSSGTSYSPRSFIHTQHVLFVITWCFYQCMCFLMWRGEERKKRTMDAGKSLSNASVKHNISTQIDWCDHSIVIPDSEALLP